ncbi:MAG: hypothetical protein ACP5Q4_01135 [Candidatus Caldatribacteriaceae bacterium]
MSAVRERVDKLEEALMRLVYIQQKTEIELQNFKDEMKAFKEEMRVFKDEMRTFKEEMNAFKEWSRKHIEKIDREMNEFKEWSKENLERMRRSAEDFAEWSRKHIENTQRELQAFREEMNEFKEWSKKNIENTQQEVKAFKEEMNEFKEWSKENLERMHRSAEDFAEWSRKQIEGLNQAWGNLANRMGTLVEDIFAPSIDIALEKYFQATPNVIDTRKKVRLDGGSLEIDILAIEHKTKRAFIVEVKGSPDRGEYVEMFLEKLARVPRFLPELEAYQRIGIYAALTMKEETIALLTRKGLYAMVLRGNVLEIVNFAELEKLYS